MPDSVSAAVGKTAISLFGGMPLDGVLLCR